MAEPDFFGFNFPFLSRVSVLEPQSGIRIIKNDLKQLLLTGLEERVMRPLNGTNLRRAPFELLDEILQGSLKRQIVAAINRDERRVTLRDVQFVSDPDKGLLEVIVMVSLKRNPNFVFTVAAEFARAGNTNIISPAQQPGVV